MFIALTFALLNLWIPVITFSTLETLAILSQVVSNRTLLALMGREGRLPPGITMRALNANVVLYVFVHIVTITFDTCVSQSKLIVRAGEGMLYLQGLRQRNH